MFRVLLRRRIRFVRFGMKRRPASTKVACQSSCVLGEMWPTPSWPGWAAEKTRIRPVLWARVCMGIVGAQQLTGLSLGHPSVSELSPGAPLHSSVCARRGCVASKLLCRRNEHRLTVQRGTRPWQGAGCVECARPPQCCTLGQMYAPAQIVPALSHAGGRRRPAARASAKAH